MTLQTSRSSLPHTGLAALLASLDMPGEIQLPDSTVVATGTCDPRYRVIFSTARALRTPMAELGVGRAYISSEIEVEGDIGALFDARERLRNQVTLRQKVRFVYDFLRSATQMNAKAIDDHYSYGDDFFLTFMDTRYRLYLHGIFASPDDTVEDASERKLEVMFTALDLKPGMRLLDIGGGLGGVTRKYIWTGAHTFMTVQDVMAKLLYHGFEIVEVKRETHDYELTMLKWASDRIIARWGAETYRVFRLYLWVARMRFGPTPCRLIIWWLKGGRQQGRVR
ncbi:cyclopropane-fatty-acyl-phospholipid synthase [Aspergillus terreus]|uniref:sphingolipid C(9)-methyltransferase n=1 Tax=Aspergillus terreus TaxID=33178 RepID=A0A5M3YSN3_ASPTE|nr:hypothetical protein ATETN484_0002023800 [Aspergillus terreus]GFF15094.1 cyclopropane-fatty-acyl-phospholipid synthase [Aspergillus terreus]